MSDPDIKVSDHAIVRYLERVHGLDTEDVRRRIAGPRVCRCHETLGDGRFPLDEDRGFSAVLVNGVVVTVY